MARPAARRQDLPRHYCRNPRCRSKLEEPTYATRDAFCARGCRDGFCRTRCRVCEGKLERKNEREQVCGRRRCRNAFKRDRARYLGSRGVLDASKTSIKPGTKSGLMPDRAWHIVAGPELSPCATVPDGSGCQWRGGDYERVEAKNRAALEAAEEAKIEANGYFAEPEWREVVSPDGVTCSVTIFRDDDVAPGVTARHVGDGLDVPDFLKRASGRP